MPFAFASADTKEENTIDSLMNIMARNSHLKNNRAIVRKAYLLAEDAHKFQKRLSGEPYITHPLAVAHILVDFKMDHESIAAALLHDVLEDTDIGRDYMEKEFGEAIIHLVDGVTKISTLKNQSREEKQAGNIRKMILATAKDARVIIIKLADKLHNMRTLDYQPQHKRERIAQEVLDIYAPLAGRLGMYTIKAELEDLSLYHIDTEAYRQIKSFISEKKERREKRMAVIQSMLDGQLHENRIKANVLGRTKHFYSIYRKHKEQQKSLSEIYDLNGVRILVESIQDCYAALGIVHTIWNPVPGRFKDYISLPKSNGYQSLHTGVIGPDGKYLEVQIRTKSMQQIAEYGIAAHWAYKEKERSQKSIQEQFQLLQNIAVLQEDGEDATLFMEEFRTNLSMSEDVYVFSPKGEIFSMPQGSTVLDFAFRIHTEVGLSCTGAKIGNKAVSIRTPLTSGDQIQIITSSHARPNSNWLRFLKTPHARAKLRNYLRRQGDSSPEPLVSREEPQPQVQTAKSQPVPKPQAPQTDEQTYEIEWSGETGIETRFAQCCSPLPGDPIVGFLSRNHVVSVHKKGCPSLHLLELQEENHSRIIPIHWKGRSDTCSAIIEITGTDRPHFFLDLVQSLARAGANILGASAHTSQGGTVRDRFNIEIDSSELLDTIVADLRRIPGVDNAEILKESSEAAKPDKISG